MGRKAHVAIETTESIKGFWYVRIQALHFFLLQEKLTEELREAMKKSRKESELNTVDSQIRGLETRLKYAKTDMESTVCIFFKFQCMHFQFNFF